MADGNDVVVYEDPHGSVIQILLNLEAAGQIDEVSMTITDENMPQETWEEIGKFLGSLDRRSRWYLGDWLNFGDAVYGQEAAQAVESTVSERYDISTRVTGLDRQTLMNVSSICRRVSRSRRRVELGFWIHSEVAALEADEQTMWLERAVQNNWHRAELRDAIRGVQDPPDPPPDPPGHGDGEHLSLGERIEQAARLVYQTWQATSDGSFLVPAEAAAQLRAALGEE